MNDLETELNALRAKQTEETTNVAEVTLAEMNGLAASIAQLRDEEDAASQVKKKATQALEAVETRMLTLLLENNLQNYKAPAGLCSVTARTSVKTPKTPQEKQALYDYLKAQGRFDDLISVNSATLNSYYKEEFELAKERGDDDFKIPGLTEVTVTPNLSFRRPK